jgi:hypothetical protein
MIYLPLFIIYGPQTPKGPENTDWEPFPVERETSPEQWETFPEQRETFPEHWETSPKH